MTTLFFLEANKDLKKRCTTSSLWINENKMDHHSCLTVSHQAHITKLLPPRHISEVLMEDTTTSTAQCLGTWEKPSLVQLLYFIYDLHYLLTQMILIYMNHNRLCFDDPCSLAIPVPSPITFKISHSCTLVCCCYNGAVVHTELDSFRWLHMTGLSLLLGLDYMI